MIILLIYLACAWLAMHIFIKVLEPFELDDPWMGILGCFMVALFGPIALIIFLFVCWETNWGIARKIGKFLIWITLNSKKTPKKFKPWSSK